LLLVVHLSGLSVSLSQSGPLAVNLVLNSLVCIRILPIYLLLLLLLHDTVLLLSWRLRRLHVMIGFGTFLLNGRQVQVLLVSIPVVLAVHIPVFGWLGTSGLVFLLDGSERPVASNDWLLMWLRTCYVILNHQAARSTEPRRLRVVPLQASLVSALSRLDALDSRSFLLGLDSRLVLRLREVQLHVAQVSRHLYRS